MQKKIFYFSLSLSSLPSLAFTYVVIRYSILRERFCGFRYSLAVRSYLLFCAPLGTWENDIKPPPKRALAVQRNTLSKSTLSRCPLRSKFKDLLTPLRAFIAQRFETVHPSESDHFFLSLSFPSFFHDREHWSSTTHCFYRWYNPNGDIQRHARGVKFKSYEE